VNSKTDFEALAVLRTHSTKNPKPENPPKKKDGSGGIQTPPQLSVARAVLSADNETRLRLKEAPRITF
jgi:hypothetical protein